MPASPPLLDVVEACTDELDRILAEGRCSIPSHQLVDRLADRIRIISRRLDEAARGKPQPATNPPVYISPDGQRVGW